jgi:hypothetical protein
MIRCARKKNLAPRRSSGALEHEGAKVASMRREKKFSFSALFIRNSVAQTRKICTTDNQFFGNGSRFKSFASAIRLV